MSTELLQLDAELKEKALKVIEKGLNGIAKRSAKPAKSTSGQGKASKKTENEKVLEKVASKAAKAIDSAKVDEKTKEKIGVSVFSNLKSAYNKVDEHLTANKLTSNDYKKVATVAMELYLLQLAKEPKPEKTPKTNPDSVS